MHARCSFRRNESCRLSVFGGKRGMNRPKPERLQYDSPGQRPGTGKPHIGKALKGRHKPLPARDLLRPFRAGFRASHRNPGRCPGLSYYGPSGRTDVSFTHSQALPNPLARVFSRLSGPSWFPSLLLRLRFHHPNRHHSRDRRSFGKGGMGTPPGKLILRLAPLAVKLRRASPFLYLFPPKNRHPFG